MANTHLRYFKFDHLPEKLQASSKPFHDLVTQLDTIEVKDQGQRDIAIQKLIEAKDAFVRSTL